MAHFGDNLSYWLPQTEAVKADFEAATSEKRILHKAAVILHLQIQAYFPELAVATQGL